MRKMDAIDEIIVDNGKANLALRLESLFMQRLGFGSKCLIA